MKVATASIEFRIPRTTLRDKLAGKTDASMKTVGPAVVLGVDTKNELVTWITSNAAKRFPINREGLLYSVHHIVKHTNTFIDGKTGKKWFYSFLRWHPIIREKYGEYLNKSRVAITGHGIRLWFEETKETLEKDTEVLNFANRVWNMDETAVFLNS
ncbi:hypothetical protein QE152_g39011 [Popillia japonica]|uniref:HTH CENPB-type domain-containing protein n=1 Tax=Popillia japonica TaxID=7064 RepID=A0AAW1HVD0_POPJA